MNRKGILLSFHEAPYSEASAQGFFCPAPPNSFLYSSSKSSKDKRTGFPFAAPVPAWTSEGIISETSLNPSRVYEISTGRPFCQNRQITGYVSSGFLITSQTMPYPYAASNTLSPAINPIATSLPAFSSPLATPGREDASFVRPSVQKRKPVRLRVPYVCARASPC